MTDRQFYAEIRVREWSEPDRFRVIGPFSLIDEVDTVDDLEMRLREGGEDVMHMIKPGDPDYPDPIPVEPVLMTGSTTERPR